MEISFHSEIPGFQIKQKKRLREWIRQQILLHEKDPDAIALIFISNEEIRKINRSYLNHNYYTDVITFEYGEGNRISGDIFISMEQVKYNAREYGVSIDEELRRVMIHGVLHLLGYHDNSEEERVHMRKLEEEALFLWEIGDNDGSAI